MSKEKQTNGEAFKTKLSIEQLRTEVLMNKKSAAEICEKYEIRPYTLQSKLYEAALTASNKTESLKFILDIPSEVSTRIERKKSLNITSSLCQHLNIETGQKFDVSKDGKKIVLTPMK